MKTELDIYDTIFRLNEKLEDIKAKEEEAVKRFDKLKQDVFNEAKAHDLLYNHLCEWFYKKGG